MSRTERARCMSELALALNIAFVCKWLGNKVPVPSFFDFRGESYLQAVINRLLHVHPHSSWGGDISFLVFTLLLAAVIFAAVRLFSFNQNLRKLFLPITGVVSLIALPVAWIYVAERYLRSSLFPNPSHVLLSLEILAVAIGSILYLNSKWPFPTWFTIFLLLLHFGLWDWLSAGGLFFWLAPFSLLFPIAGLFSSLSWGYYVSCLPEKGGT